MQGYCWNSLASLDTFQENICPSWLGSGLPVKASPNSPSYSTSVTRGSCQPPTRRTLQQAQGKQPVALPSSYPRILKNMHHHGAYRLWLITPVISSDTTAPRYAKAIPKRCSRASAVILNPRVPTKRIFIQPLPGRQTPHPEHYAPPRLQS